MKRVLVVQSSSLPDGSTYSGLLLADGLSEDEWEVHVAFAGEGPMVEKYAAAGHETHVVPHDNWLRRGRTHQFTKDVWLELRKAGAFESLIDTVRPDLVYLNTIVSLAGAVAARRANVPCVWHLREMFADIGGEMHAPRWAIPLVRWAIRRYADRLVANSAATAENLLGPHADDATVIPNAVRSQFFEEGRTQAEARSVFGLDKEWPLIGVPGTLRPMKGHQFFFDAASPLLRECEELRVAVTGEGASGFTTQLKRQVRDFGVQDQISFLGWVDDMPAFYRACDLVCIPSRAEPFGRTAIEAFAVGTPLMVTAVGGLKDIVTDGETGLLIPYGDQEGLAEGIRQLLDQPELRQKITVSARQTAEEKYHERVYKNRVATVAANVSR